MNRLVDSLFDRVEVLWESKRTPKLISGILILAFSITLLVVVLARLAPQSTFPSTSNLFLAVDISFTLLLIFEILGLIFVLPRSVADSVGKQFEILSIILLRSAFKEFGRISDPVLHGSIDIMELMPMLADAFGALLIFLIIGYYYHFQRHEKITHSKQEQQEFISFKKLLALLLLLTFTVIGITDLWSALVSDVYRPSFNTFYTILIFADVLILLYSLRYQSLYINLFRYSSYVFATLLIRLSLSSPAFINVATGVLAGAFVLGLTLIYNKFRKMNVE